MWIYTVADPPTTRFTPLLEAGATISDPSRVIVTGSVAGIGIGTTNSANATTGYSVSKAAVLHMARNLAVELGPRGILVNGIAPGFFPSKMANGLIELVGGKDNLEKANPNKRLGLPEDFAAAVVYLCSKGAGHVNGDTIVLDGGNIWARAQL